MAARTAGIDCKNAEITSLSTYVCVFMLRHHVSGVLRPVIVVEFYTILILVFTLFYLCSSKFLNKRNIALKLLSVVVFVYSYTAPLIQLLPNSQKMPMKLCLAGSDETDITFSTGFS